MCGIVGAVGHDRCGPVLLDALKRLEYRGYDSSGIVTLHEGQIDLRRAVGKLVNLETALADQALPGSIGIGHTRWATHGGVSEDNAHPHVASDRVSIVHNGIIENHRTIRARLESAGHKFASDTDSEVLAHLFVEAFDAGLDAVAATQKILAEIEGAYAFAAMATDYPEQLIVARNASPLAVGIGEGACYIGSDAIALAHLTRKVIYLKDHDFALISADHVAVYQADGTPANREAVIVACLLYTSPSPRD